MFLKRIPQIPQGIKKEIFDGFLEKGRKLMVAKIAKRNFCKLEKNFSVEMFQDFNFIFSGTFNVS